MNAFLLAVVLATTTGSGKLQPGPKHIDIDDDEVVEGATAHPEGDDILARKQERFESLIKLRTEFRRELLHSADSL